MTFLTVLTNQNALLQRSFATLKFVYNMGYWSQSSVCPLTLTFIPFVRTQIFEQTFRRQIVGSQRATSHQLYQEAFLSFWAKWHQLVRDGFVTMTTLGNVSIKPVSRGQWLWLC